MYGKLPAIFSAAPWFIVNTNFVDGILRNAIMQYGTRIFYGGLKLYFVVHQIPDIY